MTQEQKDLLLKDLCSRLPYEVKYMDILNPDEHPSTLQSIDNCGLVMANDGFSHEIENVKPYLLPMSSMTEEQRKEWQSLMIKDPYGILYYTVESYDYLYKNHIDIRGFIAIGLAIDATGLNIY